MNERWLIVLRGTHAGRCGPMVRATETDAYIDLDGPVFRFKRNRVAEARKEEIATEKAFRRRRRAEGWRPPHGPRHRPAA